jgi:hypothetical protein
MLNQINMPESKFVKAQLGDDICFTVQSVKPHTAYKGADFEQETLEISFISEYGNERLYQPTQKIAAQLMAVLGQDESDYEGSTVTLKSVPYEKLDQITKEPTGEIGYHFELVEVTPATSEE